VNAYVNVYLSLNMNLCMYVNVRLQYRAAGSLVVSSICTSYLSRVVLAAKRVVEENLLSMDLPAVMSNDITQDAPIVLDRSADEDDRPLRTSFFRCDGKTEDELTDKAVENRTTDQRYPSLLHRNHRSFRSEPGSVPQDMIKIADFSVASQCDINYGDTKDNFAVISYVDESAKIFENMQLKLFNFN